MSVSRVTCEHCEKTFATLSNLKTHQKTAKYCLKLRAGKGSSDADKLFPCDFCSKSFSRSAYMKKHLLTCGDRKVASAVSDRSTEIDLLLAKIADLETKNTALVKKVKDYKRVVCAKDKEIMRLAFEKMSAHKDGRILELKEAKPQTITTNYIHPKLVNIPITTIRPLTIETIREDVHKYTYSEFLRGLSGVKEFVESIISTKMVEDVDQERNYVCTDLARNKFHRLVESMEWTNDGGARFIHTILDELKEVSKSYFQILVDEERASVADEFKREQIDATKAVVKPVFYGITDTGVNRTKLFKALRNEIKVAASV